MEGIIHRPRGMCHVGVKELGVNHVCDQVQKVALLHWGGEGWDPTLHCKSLRPKPRIGALSKAFYVGTDKPP